MSLAQTFDEAMFDRAYANPVSVSKIRWAKSSPAPTSSGSIAGETTYGLTGSPRDMATRHDMLGFFSEAQMHDHLLVKFEPGAAVWSTDQLALVSDFNVRKYNPYSGLVGCVILAAHEVTHSYYGNAIAKSLRIALEEDRSKSGLGSAVLQGVAIVAGIERTKDTVPVFYSTDDGAYVADFLVSGGRVSCVFRDRYAHVMSALGDKFTDDVFEVGQYVPVQIIKHVNGLLAKLAK